ncbi:hypothetical protein OIU78_003178 [Salix suchowensis]|nr:hypothetical protein OIU78_003178 [Salix suchowensis]
MEISFLGVKRSLTVKREKCFGRCCFGRGCYGENEEYRSGNNGHGVLVKYGSGERLEDGRERRGCCGGVVLIVRVLWLLD